MRPSKTDLARTTLQAHGGTLGMRERRALILCDGQRGLDELVQLLGQDAPLLIQRLVRDGYLAASSSATATAPSPATSTAPAGPRRSRVAARIYLSGMLELHRDAEARHHRDRLQSRLDDDAMLEVLADAVRFLEGRVAATLAQRIRERLLEALPLEDVPLLQARLAPEDDALALP
ncbi:MULTISPECIES: hypothetical protein [unclassified Pseudoxanthomonas]|uniref:hypothetical protein n=1 Tax=unclassified Pseudoxanthomonas TaxID=2645906 RepID=UPI0008F13873|nr:MULTISPECIES: hypothetical protein [unclassified Pseudoxanthomonas]PPJ41482.1 hypothetical protein C0063_16760 [Pseudoxanthomonas sp. KAs_5_3]SFV30186.1 hypothetical protein SAMN05428990_1542 [Pseudoxanthomonas sp. YR558]